MTLPIVETKVQLVLKLRKGSSYRVLPISSFSATASVNTIPTASVTLPVGVSTRSATGVEKPAESEATLHAIEVSDEVQVIDMVTNKVIFAGIPASGFETDSRGGYTVSASLTGQAAILDSSSPYSDRLHPGFPDSFINMASDAATVGGTISKTITPIANAAGGNAAVIIVKSLAAITEASNISAFSEESPGLSAIIFGGNKRAKDYLNSKVSGNLPIREAPANIKNIIISVIANALHRGAGQTIWQKLLGLGNKFMFNVHPKFDGRLVLSSNLPGFKRAIDLRVPIPRTSILETTRLEADINSASVTTVIAYKPMQPSSSKDGPEERPSVAYGVFSIGDKTQGKVLVTAAQPFMSELMVDFTGGATDFRKAFDGISKNPRFPQGAAGSNAPANEAVTNPGMSIKDYAASLWADVALGGNSANILVNFSGIDKYNVGDYVGVALRPNPNTKALKAIYGYIRNVMHTISRDKLAYNTMITLSCLRTADINSKMPDDHFLFNRG